MRIDFEKRNRHLIVCIKGDIDHHSSEDLKNKIDKEFSQNRCQHIVFDFREVYFMDSSGIGMIMGRYKKLQESGGSGMVVVAGVREDLQRIFEISGLHKIIRCFADVESAEQFLS